MSLHCCPCRNCRGYTKIGHDPVEFLNELVSRLKMGCCRTLLKIKKEKRRLFECRSSSPDHSPHVLSYDPDSYVLNFDHGSDWADPDYASLSFSARYAVPSNVFPGAKPKPVTLLKIRDVQSDLIDQ